MAHLHHHFLTHTPSVALHTGLMFIFLFSVKVYFCHESESCSVMSSSLLYSPWNSPGQNIGVGSLSLLQGVFPTQGSNPGLPYCRQTLYHLSHQGSQCQFVTELELIFMPANSVILLLYHADTIYPPKSLSPKIFM